MNSPFVLRNPCPPGVCDCQLEQLLESPDADRRILRLTRSEERRLLERLESLKSVADLEHMQEKMYELLGIRLQVEPAHGEVRSARGVHLHFEEHPGLCRRTRQGIAAAVRRALDRQPEILWRLLDAQGLFRDL